MRKFQFSRKKRKQIHLVPKDKNTMGRKRQVRDE